MSLARLRLLVHSFLLERLLQNASVGETRDTLHSLASASVQRYFSNVYWHFVGSPSGINWHTVKAPKDISSQGTPKSDDECASIVEKILESRRLRASCTERVSEGIETEAFCCVTDIPLKDLPSHAEYYGRVALGFNAAAIHAQFLPVLYIPTAQLPQGQVGVTPDQKTLATAAEMDQLGTSFYQLAAARMRLSATHAGTPQYGTDPSLKENPLRNFLKVTEFSAKPEESFYREREWRHIGNDFSFAPEDVAAVVAPQSALPKLRTWLDKNTQYNSSVSLVAWELVLNA